MIGKIISHYKILEKLGEGGMGVVYKAEDTELKREVAIKFLPPHIAKHGEERKRFRVEAQAAAGLNHNNIATIYSIEEVDDEMFIVMEYIKGQELKTKIESSPLSIDETLNLAIQIAQGLQVAHEEGVVHRDIKSANIMITEKGLIKIMDFGLAKVRGGAQVTKVGTTLGTAAYMSPEQARGEDADARSDIWSFGVILYEMLTGRMPFLGDYEQAVIYSILNEKPQYPSEIPADIKSILEKSLEIDSTKRYQYVNELLIDLASTAKGEAPIQTKKGLKVRRPRNQVTLYAGIAVIILILAAIVFWNPFGSENQTIDSIAVLPLVNLSGDPAQEYFADGLTEALIMNLSKIRNLKVISRTSVMQYKQIKKPLPEIANELGVKAIIEGSVIREGDQVRITVQLIEAVTEKHLWAESFDRNLTNILSLQREIALAVAAQIKVVLSPEEQKRLAATEVVDPKAHENYLKGLHHLRTDTETGIFKSIEYFNRAIELTPTYALVYAELANAYLRITNWMTDAYPKATAAVQKALELDPELNEAHLAVAEIKFVMEWDWDGAEKNFLKVLEQNPNSARGHERYAIFLVIMGRFDEALQQIIRARELDPLSAWINNNVGWIHFFRREYDKSLLEYGKNLEMYPNFTMSHRERTMVYICKGMSEKAIAGAKKAVTISNGDLIDLANLGMINALAGEHEQAKMIVRQLLDLSKTRAGYVLEYEMAMIFGALGNHDKAFEYLEQAYEKKSSWAFQIKVDPAADHLRSDPRYKPFVRKMGLEP